MADEKLRILLEQRGAQDVENAIEGILKPVIDSRNELERFKRSGGLAALAIGSADIELATKRVDQLGIELLQAHSEAERLAAAISKAPESEVPKLIKQYADLEVRIASANAELGRMGQSLRESVNERGAGFLGDVDSSLAQISSSLTGFATTPLGRVGGGAGGVISGAGPLKDLGAGFMLGSDIFALAEAMPRLSAALGTTKERTIAYIASASQQAIATNTLAASAASATAPLGATASSIAALAVSAAPFIATAAAVAAGAFLLNKEFSRGKKEIDTYISAEEKRLETLRLVSEAVSSMSEEQARAEVERLQLEIETNKNIQAGLVEAYGATIKDISQLQEGASLFGTAIGEISGLDVTGLNKLKSELTTYNDAIVEAEIKLEIYNNEVLKEIQNRDRLLSLQQTGVAQGERYIQYLQDQIDREIEFNDQLQNLSVEEGRNRLAELEQRKALEEKAAQEISAIIEENNRIITEGVTAGLPEDTFADLIEENRVLYDEVSRLNEATRDYGKEIEQLESFLIPAAEWRERETKAIEDQQEKIEALKDEHEALTSSYQETIEKLSATRDQIATLQQEFLDKELERAFQENLKRQREAEDDLFRQRIAQAKATEQAAQREQRLIQLRDDTTAKAQDINQKFFNSQLKAHQDYVLKERRLTEDFNTERLRKLEDFNLQLLEAAEANDVRRFIGIQRDRDTTISRDAQDFGTEGQRRAEDLAMQSQEAQAAREKELADLRLHYEQRRQQELTQRTQENTEIARIEAEWARVREQREIQDNQRRLMLERQAFENRLAVLQQQESQLSRQIGMINASIAVNTHRTIVSSVSSALHDLRSSFGGGRLPSGAGRPGTVIHNNRINMNVGQFVTPGELRDTQNSLLNALRPV